MRYVVSLLVVCCLTSFVYAGGNGQGATVHTLVIDPGHGGMDPGAIGPSGHHEADLALAVSLSFGKMVAEAFPDVKIIYTRTIDKFVSLADRADMANKAKADLFICIHLNSATNRDAYGTSTYVLGLHRTDDNLEIAKRENAVIDLEGDRNKNYEFDPNTPEGHIIMSMKQNAFLDQSILIASSIEDELAALAKRKSRGVKQAGFWVLYKTAMPSLLAEVGFISNPTEEQYLASATGQNNIASSIFKAFRTYKNTIEGNSTTEEKKTEVQPPVRPTPPPVDQSKNSPTTIQESKVSSSEIPIKVAPTNPPLKQEEKIWEPDVNLIVSKSEPSAVVKNESSTPPASGSRYQSINQLAVSVSDTTAIKKMDASIHTTKAQNENHPKAVATQPTVDTTHHKKVVAIGEVTNHPVKNTKAEILKPKTGTDSKSSNKEVPTKEPKQAVVKQKQVDSDKDRSSARALETTDRDKVVFTVQIIAAHKPPKNYDELVNSFGIINREDIADGVVRYMAGNCTKYSEAKKVLVQAKKSGFPEAFIIGYINGERLDIKRTKELGDKYP